MFLLVSLPRDNLENCRRSIAAQTIVTIIILLHVLCRLGYRHYVPNLSLLLSIVSKDSPLNLFCCTCQVKSKVVEGYRLPHPQGCPEELYKVMLRCWAQRPTDRPHFTEVLQGCIQPLQAKAARYRTHTQQRR